MVPGGSDDWCWVGANPPQNQVAEEVDLIFADSPCESGGSSAEVAEEIVHDNQIPHSSRRDFELNRRAFSAGLQYLDHVELDIAVGGFRNTSCRHGPTCSRQDNGIC